MKKTKNIKSIVFISVIGLFVLFFSVFIGQPGLIASADNNKVQEVSASSDTKTQYYLNLGLKGQSIYWLGGFAVGSNGSTPSKTKGLEQASKLSNNNATFIFTYNRISVGEYNIITTWHCPVKAEVTDAFLSYHCKITFKDDVNINIRSEYYDILKEADFTDVTITLMYGGKGFPMCNENAGGYWGSFSENASKSHNFSKAEVLTREVPDDYDYLKEEGQIGDNGGLISNDFAKDKINNSLLYSVYLWLVENFNFTLAYSSFQLITAGVLILVLLSLFFALLARVRGKAAG